MTLICRMFLRSLLAVTFALAGGNAVQARTAAKSMYLAELSPLRTVMGAPELRMEALNGSIGATLNWSQERRTSQRTDYSDQSQMTRIEAMWYPLGTREAPIFLGAGIQHEDAMVGREQERSHITWARTSADEANDRWINHDSYLSMTQSIGYRYFSNSLVTASLAAFRDELVHVQSKTEDADEIYSADRDLKTKGRTQLRTGVTFQVGMYFK